MALIPSRPLAGTALAVLLLAGCSGAPNTAMPTDAPPSATMATTEPTASPERTEDPARPPLATQSLAVGGVTLVASAAAVTVTPDADGAVALDLTFTPGSAVATIMVDGPGSLATTADRTLQVLDGESGAAAASTAPEVTAGDRATPRVHVPDPARAEVALVAPAGDPTSGTVRFLLGDRALESADWGEREGGRSLAVVPSPWARAGGDAVLALLWSEIVEAAPEADNQSVRDQLTCHAVGAPDKARWNLEPWRPDVGLVSVLAARCNP